MIDEQAFHIACYTTVGIESAKKMISLVGYEIALDVAMKYGNTGSDALGICELMARMIKHDNS